MNRTGPAGFHDAGGHQGRHPRLQRRRRRQSGQSRGIADLCAVAEHAEGARERDRPGGSRARRSSTALATPRGTIVATSRPRRQQSDRCLVPPPRRAARRRETDYRRSPRDSADEPIVRLARQPHGDQSRDRRLGVKGAGRSSSTAGSPASVAASGVSAASSGRVARIRPERLPLEPARDERQRARRRRVAPLQIVDHEHERRIRGEIRRQPVQAVLPRVAGIAARRRSLTPDRHAGPAMSTSAASAAAPASQRSRSPGRRPPRSRARTAGARPRTETPARARSRVRSGRADRAPPPERAPPRAVGTSPSPRRPRSRRRRPPAAPRRVPQPGCARPRARARATRPAEREPTRFMRPTRSYAPQTVRRKCLGVDVRGAPDAHSAA